MDLEKAKRDYAAIHSAADEIFKRAELAERDLTEPEEAEIGAFLDRGLALKNEIEGSQAGMRVSHPMAIHDGEPVGGFRETRGQRGRHGENAMSVETKTRTDDAPRWASGSGQEVRTIRHGQSTRELLAPELRERPEPPPGLLGAAVLEKINGRVDPVLAEWRAMSELDPILGGNLVPGEMSSRWWDLARAQSHCLSLGATIMEMQSDTLAFAVVSEDPTIEGPKGENEAFTEDEVQMTNRNLVAKTHGRIIRASRELLDDAPNAADMITTVITRVMAKTVDGLCLTAILDNAGSTESAGGTIVWTDVATAFSQVEAENESPNGMIFHPTISNDLRVLASGDGTNSAANWQGAPPGADSLDWRSTSNNALGLGNAVVGDFRNLVLGLRLPIEIKISEEEDESFVRFRVGLRAVWRGAALLARPGAFATITGITS